MLKQKSIDRKEITKIFLLLVIVVFGVMYVFYNFIRFKKEQANDKFQIARSIEASLPKESLKALNAEPGDIGKPQYLVIKNILKEIIRVNPKARFAYLYTEKNGKIYFFADSEPEDSKDYSPPGQEYTEAKPEDKQPFSDGKELFTDVLSDRWGTWVKVLIPVKDEATGKTIAVFGMDYNVKSWDYFLLFHIIESVILIVLLQLAFLFVFKISAKNKSLNYEIHERKRAAEELNKLNETLEEKVAERTRQLETKNKELVFHLRETEQFTYIASHDLQEPLLTLSNFTQLLKEDYAGKMDEVGNKYIEFIHNSAGRMRALVKDLLDYSLLGKVSTMTVVDCNKIVDEVIDDMSDYIKKRNAIITVDKLPSVTANATELRLLFQNLLQNAIKFQKKDMIPEIKISAVSQVKDWIFKIKDNGIGINEKDKKKIFIIFKRMHNRNEYEGTGIGLSHCMKIVEFLGGKIWVESTPGAGSVFMFTIPKT